MTTWIERGVLTKPLREWQRSSLAGGLACSRREPKQPSSLLQFRIMHVGQNSRWRRAEASSQNRGGQESRTDWLGAGSSGPSSQRYRRPRLPSVPPTKLHLCWSCKTRRIEARQPPCLIPGYALMSSAELKPGRTQFPFLVLPPPCCLVPSPVDCGIPWRATALTWRGDEECDS